jgi:hypothetical protein
MNLNTISFLALVVCKAKKRKKNKAKKGHMEAIMSLGHWVSSSPGASKEVMIGFYLPITICTNWVT